MNLREIRSAVRNRNGIPDTGDGLAGHTDINDSVAAALRDISAESRWPWLLTSTSLTFTAGVAPLPDDCTQISAVQINGVPATQASLEDVLAGTRSYVWAADATTIQLYPVPSTVPIATLWFYRSEPVLEIDTAAPLLPATFHQSLVARASYHLNVRRNVNDRAAQDLAEYQGGLKNMMQARSRSSSPRVIRDAFRIVQQARW